MSKTSIACIAEHKGKILIAHRNPVGQMGGRWEFPGGKVEENETDRDAVVRERKEEFGIRVKVLDEITENFFEHNGKKVALHCYHIKVSRRGVLIPYKLTEHTEYKWVDIGEIPVENFVDSDLLLYPEVKKYLEEMKKS